MVALSVSLWLGRGGCRMRHQPSANWRLIGDGHGVHWPEVDEDISAEGMLGGVPARRPGSGRRSAVPANTALRPTSRAGKRRAKSGKRARAARG